MQGEGERGGGEGGRERGGERGGERKRKRERVTELSCKIGTVTHIFLEFIKPAEKWY